MSEKDHLETRNLDCQSENGSISSARDWLVVGLLMKIKIVNEWRTFFILGNTAQCRATNCQSHGEHTGIKSLLSWGYNWSNIESFKNWMGNLDCSSGTLQDFRKMKFMIMTWQTSNQMKYFPSSHGKDSCALLSTYTFTLIMISIIKRPQVY